MFFLLSPPCLTAFNHRNTPSRDSKALQAVSIQEAWEAITEKLPKLDKRPPGTLLDGGYLDGVLMTTEPPG
jgi:hypothetical protein